MVRKRITPTLAGPAEDEKRPRRRRSAALSRREVDREEDVRYSSKMEFEESSAYDKRRRGRSPWQRRGRLVGQLEIQWRTQGSPAAQPPSRTRHGACDCGETRGGPTAGARDQEFVADRAQRPWCPPHRYIIRGEMELIVSLSQKRQKKRLLREGSDTSSDHG